MTHNLPDLNKLFIDVLLLDAVLTGHDPLSGRGLRDGEPYNRIFDIEDFIVGGGHGMFYLSDGGYSRVFMYFVNGVEPPTLACGLASESRDEVREVWNKHDAIGIRRRIEETATAWYRAQLVHQ